MPSPYTPKSSKNIYRNPWLSLREDVVISSDGTEKTFGVVTMKPGSTILAINEKKEVFFVREFKYGINRETLELPSGAIEKDETPLEAARRELEEEIGFHADTWIDAGFIDPFTTVINSPNFLFIALDLHQTQQHLDEGEFLTVERIPFNRAVEMAVRSETTHGGTCTLLLKAKEILREKGIEM